MPTDPQDIRRMFDKFVLLWELNPDWRVGELLDNVHYAANVEAGNYPLDAISNKHLEYGLDALLEGSKNRG